MTGGGGSSWRVMLQVCQGWGLSWGCRLGSEGRQLCNASLLTQVWIATGQEAERRSARNEEGERGLDW